LNVFTLNKRSVMLIHANFGPGREAVPVAFVAIGGKFIFFALNPSVTVVQCLCSAMLVGSIGWSKKTGDKVAKGEELGWFQVSSCTRHC